MALRLCGSTPTVGSSRISTSGSCRSAAAMFRRRFMPPLKVAGLSRARSARPTSDSAASTRSTSAARRAARRARRTARGSRRRRGSRRSRAPAARRRCGASAPGCSRSSSCRAAPFADEDAAAIGGDQPAQHRHRRRLAGAVRPEQADDLAGADRERQVGDDGAAAVRFAKALGFEHRCPFRGNRRDSKGRSPGVEAASDGSTAARRQWQRRSASCRKDEACERCGQASSRAGRSSSTATGNRSPKARSRCSTGASPAPT